MFHICTYIIGEIRSQLRKRENGFERIRESKFRNYLSSYNLYIYALTFTMLRFAENCRLGEEESTEPDDGNPQGTLRNQFVIRVSMTEK